MAKPASQETITIEKRIATLTDSKRMGHPTPWEARRAEALRSVRRQLGCQGENNLCYGFHGNEWVRQSKQIEDWLIPLCDWLIT